jgi:predicted esterase
MLPEVELRDFAPRVFSLHAAGDSEAARDLVVDALPQLRSDDAEIVTFWQACLDASTGRVDEALADLETAINKGWWYGTSMLADHDFDAIRDEPRFRDIVARSEAAQIAAQRVVPVPIIADPEGVPRGTLVAIHAAEGRASHTSRIWSPGLSRGYRTVAVSSSRKVSSLRATWDDRSRALADVTAQIRGSIHPMIFGGRSLGAAVALHLATTGAVPAAGLVLVAPTLRWELARPSLPIPTVILAGANDSDRLRAAASQAARFLTDAGSPVDLQFIPEMSHYYPDDFETWLIPSIDWIESKSEVIGSSKPQF